jgi:hypothetical protein
VEVEVVILLLRAQAVQVAAEMERHLDKRQLMDL